MIHFKHFCFLFFIVLNLFSFASNNSSYLNYSSSNNPFDNSSKIESKDTSRVSMPIKNEPLDYTWFEPNKTPGTIGKHKKMELGFALPIAITEQINQFLINGNGGINPFDPDAIDFKIHLTAPDGSKITRFAFYYAAFSENVSGNASNPSAIRNEFIKQQTAFPWRFRFCPNEEGTWGITIEVIIPGSETIHYSDLWFNCIPSNHKGILQVSQTNSDKDRWMYYSETGEPFFAISENIASAGECGYFPSQMRRQLEGVQKLIDAGGNFTRFELGGQSALPDWPIYNNYNSKLDEMFAFDKLVEKCEENDIYFTLFRHHVEVMDRENWADIRWELNPYHVGLNSTIIDYFSDAKAVEWQNKCLRYIFSRWGYSSNMSFYSYSEVDNWYTKLLEVESKENIKNDNGNLSQKDAVLLVKGWIENQHSYIKKELNNSILFCHSPARLSDLEKKPETSFFSISDVVGLHSYGERKNINFEERYDKVEEYWERYKKPVFLEEMGPNKIAMFCCTGIEFHNSIWSTAMMGGIGTGMDWWWDGGVFDMNYQVDLKHIALFFDSEDLRAGNYSPQKWKDASIDKMKLEHYALEQENKERALGWIHNATFYWRNMVERNSCLKNIIEGTSSNNTPCYFRVDPNGHPYSKLGYACPIEHSDVYKHENLKDFDHPQLKDAFTEKGGAQIIHCTEGNSKNPTFRISNLKSSGLFAKKHWYSVQFYYTQGNNFGVVANETQVLSTNRRGMLEPHVPNLDFENPDFAYKAIYIGEYKKSERSDKSLR